MQTSEPHPFVLRPWSNAYIVGIIFLFIAVVHALISAAINAFIIARRADIGIQAIGMIFSVVGVFNLLLGLAMIVLLTVIAMRCLKGDPTLYFSFSGRISRLTNFYGVILPKLIFAAILCIALVPAVFFESYRALVAASITAPVCCLALLLIWPDLATRAKRAHDIGLSAWWLFLLLVPLVGAIFDLVLWFKPGDRGANRFGPDPQVQSLS